MQGLFHGSGTYTYASGGYYDGSWLYGRKKGNGCMKAFDEYYKGEWANNAKMGTGVYIWPNGDTYEGEFISDLREGKGTYSWKDKTVLEGWWQADQLNGEAKFTDFDLKKNRLIFLNGKLLQI